MNRASPIGVAALSALFFACSSSDDEDNLDAGTQVDAAAQADVGFVDAAPADATPSDSEVPDAGFADAATPDLGAPDSGDEPPDTGVDGGVDAGTPDTGPMPDSGCPRPELQGASGTYSGPAPVAYYTFDDADRTGPAILDVTGNGYDATANTAAEAGLGIPGVVGEAVELDGAAALVNSSPPQNQIVSASMWIKPNGWPTSERKVILNQGNGPGAWQGWGFSIRPNGTGRAFLEGGVGQVNEHTAGTNACVAPTEWTHLALTFDGSDLRLYQNGVLQETTPTNLSTINYGTNGLVLGRHSFFQNAYYNGAIDEVAVFDATLSEQEVGEIYLLGRDGLHFVQP